MTEPRVDDDIVNAINEARAEEEHHDLCCCVYCCPVTLDE